MQGYEWRKLNKTLAAPHTPAAETLSKLWIIAQQKHN